MGLKVPHVLAAFACTILICSSVFVNAQDTTRISVTEADRVFLERNLDIIASRYNISAADAGVIQARLYPNPTLNGEFNVVDPQNKKLLHVGQSGQVAVAAQQVLLLGGKRKDQIEIAKGNVAIARLELEELMRDLKRKLNTSMYSVHFDELTLKKYNTQLNILDSIISNYEQQAVKGNISLKEVVRLKSVYLTLNNDKTALLQDIEAEQKNLKVLLQTNDYILPEIDSASWERMKSLVPVDSLLNLAKVNRPDWQKADRYIDLAALNLKYQKSLAVPDIILGGAYDQLGGAFRNQVNFTFGMPIPLWHRNQGNTRQARTLIDLTSAQGEKVRTGIVAEVIEASNNMRRAVSEYRKSNEMYGADFSEVSKGVTDNFRKRNISIIEFVDFFEAYNQSVAAVNQIRKQVAVCAENLNYVTGTSIY